jgi:hypothetical protein
MKFVIIGLLLLLLRVQAVVYDPVEGICLATKYPECPDEVQVKGMCCKRAIGEPLRYFKNSCLACQAVLHLLLRVAAASTISPKIQKIAANNSFRHCDNHSPNF